MRPRVLHLIDTGGPGGAETVLHDLVTGLDARGWDATVAVPIRDWLHEALRESGIDPVVVSTHGSFDVRYLQRLLGLARSGPTLIHAHLLTSSVYGSIAGALARLPVICTFHGTVDIAEADRFRSLKFRLINDVARARVVFVSDSLRRSFVDAVPLTRSRTFVIHNGIDTARFHPAIRSTLRRELGIGDAEFIVGAIGNVRPAKGYDVLLRAAALLGSSEIPYRFVVAGQRSGELYDELIALHRELGLGDRVQFIGFRRDVPEILAGLDVYVSSSTAEGFSLTTAEAMACGTPVVATRSGGPEEIIEDGANGILAEPASPSALADAIGNMAQDHALRRRFAAAGRESVARRFTVGTMVGAYERLYESLLNRPGSVTRDAALVAASPLSGLPGQ